MSFAERTRAGIEGWFVNRHDPETPSWSERIQDSVVSWFARAALKFVEDREPEVIDLTREYLTEIRGLPNLPPYMANMIDKALTPGDWLSVGLGYIGSVLGIIPSLLGRGMPLGNLWTYDEDRVLRSARLDPISVITLWRRWPAEFAKYIDDLRDKGWSEDRIEALKAVTEYYPGPQDLINWQAKEVFEPAMVERYGLDDELGGVDPAAFYKAGMTDEQIKNYWRAHWQHASWNQVVEMLRRGQLTEAELWDWFRVVEIPPYWREKLIAISWAVPTRVDVRRFWDMRTIDEARLREIYTAQGYHGKDLDDYVLWTKIYVAFPDLIARWKNGWITLDDIRAELVGLGMPPDRVEEMIQAKIKSEEPARTAAERDITKADVYKGVKQNRITRDEALEILQDLGYSADEADYLLAVNIPEDGVDAVVADRQLTKSDIKTAFVQGIITRAEAVARLVELRYGPADAELLVQIYAATIPDAAVAPARELTKADILKGYKAGIIGAAETLGMLADLRYPESEAAFLLEANTPPEDLAAAEEARQLTKADIVRAFAAGILPAADLVPRLEDLGYTPEDAALLGDVYGRVEELRGITRPREASKADVVLAVKKGLITAEEAYLMLQDLGFTPEASQFILTVRAEESPFSPINFPEFKDRAAKYRRAAGLESHQVTEDLKAAAAKVVQLSAEVKALDELVREEEADFKVSDKLPETATAELKRRQVARNRKRSELSRAKTDYAGIIALWRGQSPPT